jgi:hypothetical protein
MKEGAVAKVERVKVAIRGGILSGSYYVAVRLETEAIDCGMTPVDDVALELRRGMDTEYGELTRALTRGWLCAQAESRGMLYIDSSSTTTGAWPGSVAIGTSQEQRLQGCPDLRVLVMGRNRPRSA